MNRRGEQGQALVEYALILVGIVLVVWIVLLMFGPELSKAFSQIIAGL